MDEDDVSPQSATEQALVGESAAPAADAAPQRSNEPSLLDAITEGLSQPKGESASKPTPEAAPASVNEVKPGVNQARPAQPSAAPAAAEDPYAEPAGLKAEASKRFQHLVREAKSARGELEQAQGTINALRDALGQAGATQEDFGRFLAYQRAVSGGDYGAARAALQEQMRLLALASGQPVEPPDPLKDYPDLQQRVANFELDQAAALQLARAKEIERMALAAREQELSQREQSQRQHNERAQAGQAIAAWAKNKAGADVNFAEVERLVMPQINRMVASMPPTLWLQQLELLYDQASAALAAARPRAGNGAGGFKPLRPSGGGGQAAPNSLYDAIAAGMGWSG